MAVLNARAAELLARGVGTVELTEDLAGDRCVLHLLVHAGTAEAGAWWDRLRRRRT